MMRSLTRTLAGVLAALFSAGLAWRLLCRRFNLPMPPWIARLGLSRAADLFAETRGTLTRIGALPGERVLDAGAGPGRLTLPLVRAVGSAGEVVAVDVRPEMIRELRHTVYESGLSNVVMYEADLRKPLDDARGFDRVVLAATLGEIPDRDAVIGHLVDVLRPGGVLSVTELFTNPNYVPYRTIQRLCIRRGLVLEEERRSWVGYTANFCRPARTHVASADMFSRTVTEKSATANTETDPE